MKEWKRLCKEFDDGTYMAQRGLRMAFEERLKVTNTSKAVKGNIVREHRAMTQKEHDAKRMRDEEKSPSSDGAQKEQGSTSEVWVLGRDQT